MPSLRPEPDSHQRLLVPFASASAPECHAVLTGLALPNLSALLAELTPLSPDAGDDHTLAPPHETAALLGPQPPANSQPSPRPGWHPAISRWAWTR
jgi:hypothetical protein